MTTTQDPVALSGAAFAADVSLALSATLNLRRTLGRALSFAVPAFAPWAHAGVTDGSRVLRMHAVDGHAPSVDEDATRAVTRPIPAAGTGVATSEDELVDLGLAAPFGRQVLHEAGRAVRWVRVPLVARGTARGVLVLLQPDDGEPGAVPPDLQVLADRTATAVDAALVYEQRNALATTLRSALLPPQPPQVPGVRIGARYRAALETSEIGGDFYDFHRTGSGRWSVALGDVCGKGVDAAVLTGQVRQALRVASVTHDDPAAVLQVLNDAMLLNGSTSFVTVVCASLEPRADGLHLQVAAGGHPPALVLRTDGSVEDVGPTGALVGLLPDLPMTSVRVVLHPGDTCLLYTDGVTEARTRGGEPFGEDRLHHLLADCLGMPARAISERVEQVVMEHLRGEPRDDIAVLVLQAEPDTSTGAAP